MKRRKIKKIHTFNYILIVIFSLSIAYAPSTSAEFSYTKACSKSKLNTVKDGLVCLKQGKKYRWIPDSSLQKNEIIEYSQKVADKSECQLKDARILKTQPNNVGFPLSQGTSQNSIKPTGEINIAFIPIDFPNIKGDEKSMEVLSYSIEKMSEWYNFFSNGKLKMKYQSSRSWFTAPKNSYEYVAGKGRANNANPYAQVWDLYAQEFIDSTEKYYNFSNVDVVLFHFPNNVKTGLTSEVLGRGVTLNTPQGKKDLVYFGAGERSYELERNIPKPYTRLWGLWIHEILHSHGLAVHGPGNGWEAGVGTNQQGESLSITSAWELFLLGWLDDYQIYCLPVSKISSNIIEITPLEISGSKNKMVAIPLDQYRVIVLNSRRPVGFSSEWSKDSYGILAHIVDTRLDNDRSCEGGCDNGKGEDLGNDKNYSKWGYYIMPDNPNIVPVKKVMDSYKNYFLKKGMTLTFENVIIKVLESGNTDTILVERKS